MRTLRLGIIGIGFFGEKHAEVVSSLPQVELAAVSTRRPERLREIAARFKVPKTYTDYRDLLADPDIDAVSIVTHIDQHTEMAVAALAAGKHVFLEKPMADTVEHCRAIIAAADASAGKLMIGHICRFDQRVVTAVQAIRAGKIGRIVSMHATRNLPVTIGRQVLDKISPISGDGIHDTDLMLWMTQSAITSVYAKTVMVHHHRHPDLGWCMYEFASGAVGVFESIWMLPANTPFQIDARMEIIGTEGAIYINAGNSGIQINDAESFYQPDTMYWPELYGKRTGALRYELEYFADCIIHDRPIEVITPKESMAAVQAVSAAEESAKSGRVVTLA